MTAELRASKARAAHGERNTPVAELEAYRQLVEIQKQLVEMSRQNEQTRRECDALRERVAIEMNGRRRLRQRLQHQASRLLRQLPRTWKKSGLKLIGGNLVAGAVQKVVKAVGK